MAVAAAAGGQEHRGVSEVDVGLPPSEEVVEHEGRDDVRGRRRDWHALPHGDAGAGVDEVRILHRARGDAGPGLRRAPGKLGMAGPVVRQPPGGAGLEVPVGDEGVVGAARVEGAGQGDGVGCGGDGEEEECGAEGRGGGGSHAVMLPPAAGTGSTRTAGDGSAPQCPQACSTPCRRTVEPSTSSPPNRSCRSPLCVGLALCCVRTTAASRPVQRTICSLTVYQTRGSSPEMRRGTDEPGSYSQPRSWLTPGERTCTATSSPRSQPV